jgi:hypothetical protein
VNRRWGGKMDKTLSDYIKRIQDLDKQRIAENRNVWNDPELAKQDVYYVNPESQSIDSDEKINPYSQH